MLPLVRLATVLDALSVADEPADPHSSPSSSALLRALERLPPDESACFAWVPHDVDSVEFVMGPTALPKARAALSEIKRALDPLRA